MTTPPTLFESVDGRLRAMELIAGPGQARASDPGTSREAARLVKARATSARVRLLETFALFPSAGLTDEEAAHVAGLSPTSEYATRCSELTRMGVLEMTGATRSGRAGMERVVRRITPAGRQVLTLRGEDERR